MGFRVLSYSEVPFIDGVRFMSSRFGNCYQAWTCSTGHDDASVCLLWMDVRIGVCGKNPMIVFTVSKYNQGVVWCSWGVGWTGRCVQFSPSTRRLFRPRWGWRPCCSACLEAETTWTLPRFPSSSNPVLPPRNWPAGHIKQRSCGSDGWKLSWSARRINARFSLFTKRYFFRQQYYSLGSLQSMLQPVISLDIFADER